MCPFRLRWFLLLFLVSLTIILIFRLKDKGWYAKGRSIRNKLDNAKRRAIHFTKDSFISNENLFPNKISEYGSSKIYSNENPQDQDKPNQKTNVDDNDDIKYGKTLDSSSAYNYKVYDNEEKTGKFYSDTERNDNETDTNDDKTRLNDYQIGENHHEAFYDYIDEPGDRDENYQNDLEMAREENDSSRDFNEEGLNHYKDFNDYNEEDFDENKSNDAFTDEESPETAMDYKDEGEYDINHDDEINNDSEHEDEIDNKEGDGINNDDDPEYAIYNAEGSDDTINDDDTPEEYINGDDDLEDDTDNEDDDIQYEAENTKLQQNQQKTKSITNSPDSTSNTAVQPNDTQQLAEQTNKDQITKILQFNNTDIHHIETVQRKLLNQLDETCDGKTIHYRGKVPLYIVESNTFANLNHNIVFCQVQKVASTFWKRVLEFIQRKDSKKYRSPFDVQFNDISMSNIRSYKGNKKLLFQKSFKFMFVRSPYERLFSGYVDKFFAPNPVYWRDLGIFIQNITRTKGERSECGQDISFKEFISFVVSESYRERHFTPQYEHCRPCEMKFDFIGKMENFEVDASYILRKIQDLSNISLQSTMLKSTTDKDAIEDLVKRLYFPGWIRMASKCISVYETMLRTWRVLQIRGILSTKTHLPFEKSEAETIPRRVFEQAAWRAYDDLGGKNLRKKNKMEAMREAYATLSPQELTRLKEMFKPDFELFNYDPNPQELFGVDKNRSSFQYFSLDNE